MDAGPTDGGKARDIVKRERRSASKHAREGFRKLEAALLKHLRSLYVNDNGESLPPHKVYPADAVFIVRHVGGANTVEKPWGIQTVRGTSRIQAAGGEEIIAQVNLLLLLSLSLFCGYLFISRCGARDQLLTSVFLNCFRRRRVSRTFFPASPQPALS